MRNIAAFCALFSVANLVACGGDDVSLYPSDASDVRHEASTGDATILTDAGGDTSPIPVDAGNDAPPPPRLLLSINDSTTSELVALNIGTKQIDGRLGYPGFLGTTFSGGDDPWLLEQSSDVVARLDRQQPWKLASSWNVALTDKKDGGDPYSDPYAVLVSADAKAYVLRFTRNVAAVVDTKQTVDGGAPTGTVDFEPLLQTDDADGLVEMTTGFYVASRHLVYVLLGNFDKTQYGVTGLGCANTSATVTAIDTQTNQIVSLGGSGKGGAITLSGFSPTAAVYDAAADRILVVHAGCVVTTDAGSSLVKSGVEAVSLMTKSTKMLLDGATLGYPGSFVYLDSTHALIGFGFGSQDVHTWDPTSTTLGPVIPNAPDSNSFVADRLGNILGVRTTPLDGGKALDVVSVRISDGQQTKLVTNPFTDNTGYVGGVEIWPHP